MTSAVAVSCEADLCQVFHVWRLDVHHIEALLGVVQVPQVDSQVITGDECLLITADRDCIYVVGVCIAKHTPTSCLHDLLCTSDLQIQVACVTSDDTHAGE